MCLIGRRFFFLLRISARKAAALLAGRRCSTNAQGTAADEQRLQRGADVRFNVRSGNQIGPCPAGQPRIDDCFSPAHVPLTNRQWLTDLAGWHAMFLGHHHYNPASQVCHCPLSVVVAHVVCIAQPGLPLMHKRCTVQGGFTGVSKVQVAQSVTIANVPLAQRHNASARLIFVPTQSRAFGSHSPRTNDGDSANACLNKESACHLRALLKKKAKMRKLCAKHCPPPPPRRHAQKKKKKQKKKKLR